MGVWISVLVLGLGRGLWGSLCALLGAYDAKPLTLHPQACRIPDSNSYRNLKYPRFETESVDLL